MGSTFTLPGQTVIPRNYGERVVLYTAGDEVRCVVDGAPPGKFGRLFVVESNKPTSVPYEAARFILEHLSYTGVVRVKETEKLDDEGNVIGIAYDVDGAREESLALFADQDKRRFDQYVRDCVQDYIAHPKGSKPVPQPSPSIMAIIERRGYDLRKYGIVPIGWEEPDKDKRLGELEALVRTLMAEKEAAASEPPPPIAPPAPVAPLAPRGKGKPNAS